MAATDVLHGARLDWSKLEDVREPAEQLLRAVAADKRLMRDLVDRAEHDPDLRSMCEKRHLWRRLVLEDRLSDGIRLRLHAAEPRGLEIAHDHRFPFATLILAGGYLHTLYTPPNVDPDELLPADEEGWQKLPPDRPPIQPILERYEPAGTTYTISDQAIHRLWCDEPTVTLFLRGPAVKRRSTSIDPEANAVRFLQGQATEPEEERQQRLLDDHDFEILRAQIEEAGII